MTQPSRETIAINTASEFYDRMLDNGRWLDVARFLEAHAGAYDAGAMPPATPGQALRSVAAMLRRHGLEVRGAG